MSQSEREVIDGYLRWDEELANRSETAKMATASAKSAYEMRESTLRAVRDLVSKEKPTRVFAIGRQGSKVVLSVTHNPYGNPSMQVLYVEDV